MKAILIMALCALLAACGGGGDEPDVMVGPPDCSQGACR